VLAGAGLAQATLPRFGARAVSLFGLLLAAAGLLYLSRLDAGSDYLGAVVPGFAAMGFGVGNVWLPMTMAATGKVDGGHQGLASGLVNTSQQIGGALGLAVLSTLANERTSTRIAEATEPAVAAVEGYTLGFAVGAGLLLAAFVVLLAGMRADDVDVRGTAGLHGGAAPAGREEPAAAAA
jgi:hypothetical protein